VGDYPITAASGTLSAANYAFSFSNGMLRVIATQPVIESITHEEANNDFVITWTSLSNATYRLQYVSDLTSTNWTDLAPDITATNSTSSAVDSPGNAPRRFYRVYVVPQ
jgi:hypothetical protein